MAQEAFTNRLIHEKSPYLLQHAHNPVDWYPWGEEAFKAARDQDKPILLSIGYATCHWCHVMEKESFENPDVAKALNDVFINIKVDREELPEIDSIYMEFAQALMASAGGWPLNVVLTPDLKPFFAVTYLPPKTSKGLVGLDEFSNHMKQLWQSEGRDQLIEQANKIVELLARASNPVGEELPSELSILNAAELLFELADPLYGGTKGAPKFPLGYQAEFLLQLAKTKNESRALFYVELTLDNMARGGIHDHIGGGFSRYAIDEKWIIPHFEKMLYDNAVLARAYVRAAQFTKKPSYREIAEKTFSYVLREMVSPDGGFYSAQDADIEGHEGAFYTWTYEELKKILPGELGDLFCQFYGVIPKGNFEGRNILYMEEDIEEFAQSFGFPIEEIQKQLEEARRLVLEARKMRRQPFKDDKIISSWNGLMIDALARGSIFLEKKELLEAAVKAAEFIKGHLWQQNKLLRRYRDGEARFSAGLDDYAFLIGGALTLFEMNAGNAYLSWAIQMAKILEENFKAPKGAFYQTDGKEPILIRKCEYYDGAEPSGNAVHCENLLRLYQITGQDGYLGQAEDILKAAKNYIESYPPGATYHLFALQRYLNTKAPTFVIALDEKRNLEKEIKTALSSHFSPHSAVIWKGAKDTELEQLIPSLSVQKPVEGQTTLYLCRRGVCEPPLVKKEAILQAIEKEGL